MRVVTWNCQMGFAKKADFLFALQPDIAVIQECSKRSALAAAERGYLSLWFGGNKAKGMAVLWRAGWKVKAIAKPKHTWIVGLKVEGPETFTLVAVWSWVKGGSLAGYVNEIRGAMAAHPRWFKRGPVVMAGDFNSNCRADNFTGGGPVPLLAQLAKLKLVSAYHSHCGEEHGKESRPTFHQYRHTDKPFHIDYVFVSPELAARVSGCEVGGLDEWLRMSDHCPLVVDIVAAKREEQERTSAAKAVGQKRLIRHG